MIIEAVRIVADWLAHSTEGVNAIRASVPRDTGVSTPPAVTVLDSTRDGRVARGGVPALEPSEFPALLVSPSDEPIEQQAIGSKPFAPDGRMAVLVRVASNKVDTAEAERDTSQLCRAIQAALPRLVTTAAGEAARTRAAVQLISIESLATRPLYEANEDAVVTGAIAVTLRVRDTHAHT